MKTNVGFNLIYVERDSIEYMLVSQSLPIFGSVIYLYMELNRYPKDQTRYFQFFSNFETKISKFLKQIKMKIHLHVHGVVLFLRPVSAIIHASIQSVDLVYSSVILPELWRIIYFCREQTHQLILFTLASMQGVVLAMIVVKLSKNWGDLSWYGRYLIADALIRERIDVAKRMHDCNYWVMKNEHVYMT